MRRWWSIAGLLWLGCGGGQTAGTTAVVPACGPDQTHRGSLVATASSELTAVSRCRVIEGNLAIRGADIANLSALSGLRRVTGDVRIGPTFALDAVSGLDGLRRVGGRFVVSSNPIATGVFFGGLTSVAGDVIVQGNAAALTVSLHRLGHVGGSIRVSNNDSLLRLDLSALVRVGGKVVVSDNPKLDTFAAKTEIRKRARTKNAP